MNYNSDKPINTVDQDLLGRSSFSKQLGNAIYNYDVKDGLVVGLLGKWGTGKTSVINMALNEIESLSVNDENKPIIVKFSPWNYSDKDNLISRFFQCLKNKIVVQDNEELKKKVGKALNDYSGALDALSLVPVVGPGIAAIFKTVAQTQGSELMKDSDLDKNREILEEALQEANKKIIVIIDDIDRLTNSQIRDVFQLVKQVADFPNIIYILAMDREVVSNALTEVHNINGNEYLEKIVQVPFELPELRMSKLHSIFFSKLDQIIQSLPGKVEWDKNYWSSVFRNCIEPYIQTLRDVNRIVNTFQFRYGMVYQETSFEDMVALTTLEVLEPSLYKWISQNKDAVCGGFLHSLLSTGGNKPDYRKQYCDEFERMGINPDTSLKFVSTLFPVFANDIKEHQYEYQSSSSIRSNMRAAHEERFEVYFMADLDDIKVPRNVINICVYEANDDQLRTIIEEINHQGNIAYFLDELRALIDKIPYNRLSLIASVLLDMQGEYQGETSRALFSISASDTAEYAATEIIERLQTEEEKNIVIRTAVEKVDNTGLGAIARFINRIELAYGRLAGTSEDKSNQIISLEHLVELEEIYTRKIGSMAKEESLLEIEMFYMAFYLWECLNNEAVNEYIQKLFAKDINKLKFVCAMAGRWNGTNGSGWDFNSNSFTKYISDNEVNELIQKLLPLEIDKFTQIEQIKLASFALNYNKNEMDHVNEEVAIRLVSEWKESSGHKE